MANRPKSTYSFGEIPNSRISAFYYRYETILKKVQSDYGVDSFKFDAGEINYVTGVPNYQLHENVANLGRYTQYYAECAARYETG